MSEINPIDLQKALKGATYPAGREDLVGCAESNHADGLLVEKLRQLPDQRFEGPNDVQKEVFHGQSTS
ncbi:MAG TPA: DUF2795 domain-containing protein [Actinospica sp.]|jgi:hypothetical protein|nr:DUF2795 domain-containing protein [Actinospica sp.]